MRRPYVSNGVHPSNWAPCRKKRTERRPLTRYSGLRSIVRYVQQKLSGLKFS